MHAEFHPVQIHIVEFISAVRADGVKYVAGREVFVPHSCLMQPPDLRGECGHKCRGAGVVFPVTHLGGTCEFEADIAASAEPESVALLSIGYRAGGEESE